MLQLFAFIILLVAGLYLSELSWKVVGIYLIIAALAFTLITLMKWNLVIWITFLGFIDAILVLHIFKGNITIRRW